MIRKIFVTTVGIFLSVTAAQAGSVQIGINDNSVEGVVSQQIIDDQKGTTEVYARGLYNDRTSSSIGEIGLDVFGGIADLPGMRAGVGIRLAAIDADNEKAEAVALGVNLRFNPPALQGVGVRAQIFYAPKILTFGEGERLLESAIQLEYEFMPRARAFVGYGYTMLHTEDLGDVKADDSFRVGAEFGF
ncbi:MAG: hypothetical protein A2511_01530 [Deltaproteobacteria bacterium RIFOXYD12_FULL_50_9]|nr:MAG: hypothetical protein A2511_01530 [Deltaproteobacteria bacterium RIFOXYD12_FULL_50_9]